MRKPPYICYTKEKQNLAPSKPHLSRNGCRIRLGPQQCPYRNHQLKSPSCFSLVRSTIASVIALARDPWLGAVTGVFGTQGPRKPSLKQHSSLRDIHTCYPQDSDSESGFLKKMWQPAKFKIKFRIAQMQRTKYIVFFCLERITFNQFRDPIVTPVCVRHTNPYQIMQQSMWCTLFVPHC